MASTRAIQWHKLPISLRELCINTSLRCGQSFRWSKSEDDIWSCALHGRILSLRQDSTHLYYRASYPESSAPPTPPSSAPTSTADNDDNTEALIRHYFNLEPSLTDLYKQWSTVDLNFKKKALRFTGVRILRQDAWEALAGFICSSNNNIIRISQMMEKLCIYYGPLIGLIDSKPYYDMPSPAALVGPQVEMHLRELGFGYRAKYLHQTALMLSRDHGDGWLDSLRNPESPIMGCKVLSAGEMLSGGREGYRIAHEKLLSLQGVGPKVADCVCLMGLGWGEAVPVDTHVWQIAQRDYKFGRGKHRSLTKATYDAVGDHFRSLWGKEAGWAHSVLFTADLRAFSERLTAKTESAELQLKAEMEDPQGISSRTTEVFAPNVVKREFAELEESGISSKTKVKLRTVKRRRKA